MESARTRFISHSSKLPMPRCSVLLHSQHGVTGPSYKVPSARFGAPAAAGVRHPGVRGARSSKSFYVGRRDWVRAETAGVCTVQSSLRITAACTREPTLGGASSSERSSLNPPSSYAFHPNASPSKSLAPRDSAILLPPELLGQLLLLLSESSPTEALASEGDRLRF